jgi:hypothetical protein
MNKPKEETSDLPKPTAAQVAVMRNIRILQADVLTWMAIHGSLCLALRHPSYKGPSRKIVKKFCDSLGNSLVIWQALTPEQLELVHKTEAEKSPHHDD